MGAGPERLIEAGLVTRLREAGHSVATTPIELPNGFFPAEVQSSFELNRALARAVAAAESSGAFPLILSGNCSSALGTVSGLGDPSVGVLWFDAHGDFNTPDTTPSGFFDGTALATLTGHCWKTAVSDIPGFAPVAEEAVLLVGARSIDAGEGDLLSRSGIERVSAEQARDDFASRLARHRETVKDLYLHVDLDVLDRQEGTANSYAEPHGMTAAELKAAVRDIATTFHVRAAALTAFDPAADDGRVCTIALDLAVALVDAADHRV
jgi:arginase